MPAHLVSNIDTKQFGAETIRIGDLNGDGAPDLLFVQSIYGTRKVSCLTATTILGNVLWQVGDPSAENAHIYSDLPVQVYDWDNDGRNEVLYVQQARYAEPVFIRSWDGRQARERARSYEGDATMIVLDGSTGREKRRFPLPAPPDDSFLFADLTGQGRRRDLVVKDRYWNLWGIAHSGEVMWHRTVSTGHFPAVADVDGDGRDEVFVGLALIDQNGQVLFERDGAHADEPEKAGAHQDAVCIVRLPDRSWRLLSADDGVHCLAPDGTEFWQRPVAHAQHVVAGTFRTDSPMQFAVVERGEPGAEGRGPAELHLYDVDGREIWRRRQPEGSWMAAAVTARWFGSGAPHGILVYERGPDQPAAIYDGAGDIADMFAMQLTAERSEEDRRTPHYGLAADVWGDSRDEVILFGSRGACVYANARPCALPTLYNETLYPGM